MRLSVSFYIKLSYTAYLVINKKGVDFPTPFFVLLYNFSKPSILLKLPQIVLLPKTDLLVLL